MSHSSASNLQPAQPRQRAPLAGHTCSDEFTSFQKYAPREPKQLGGLNKNWGIQPLWNLFIGKYYFKRIALCVPHTLIPILKLCSDDRKEIDVLYAKIKALHEPTRFYDSPQERWRKFYGNMIREIEWACFELKKYFNKGAYEDLIIHAANDYIQEVLTSAISLMDKMMCFGKDHGHLIGNLLNRVISRLTGTIFEKVINITGFLVGDVKVGEFDFRKGQMMLEATDCLWLRSPRMKDFPEEGCLLVCKGACEKAFSNFRTRLILDPRLPESSCELRYYVDDAS